MSNRLELAWDQLKTEKFIFIAVVAMAIAVTGLVQITHGLAGGGYGYGTTQPTGPSPVFRNYKSTNGDHLFTINAGESATGYVNEGVGFNGYPTTGTNPAGGSSIYRAYNPTSGDHFLTVSFAEYANAQSAGYKLEGVGFYDYQSISDPSTSVFVNPVYRVYSPSGSKHFYTTSTAERDAAVAAGSIFEGNAFWAP